MASDWRTLPNYITLFRLALVPVFLALLASGHLWWAAGCFALAMASDLVDGLLARLLQQRSHFGAVMDPIADKVMVISALASLWAYGRLPTWLVLLVGFRDASMGLGAYVVRRRNLEVPAAPSRAGKYATFALSLLIVLALAHLVTGAEPLAAYTAVLGFIAALCVAVSIVQYLARFGHLLWSNRSRPSASDERQGHKPR